MRRGQHNAHKNKIFFLGLQWNPVDFWVKIRYDTNRNAADGTRRHKKSFTSHLDTEGEVFMIITQKKPIEELMALVADAKTVALVGCGSCATACQTGGEAQIAELLVK